MSKLLILLLVLLPGLVSAQALVDPTRPPADSAVAPTASAGRASLKVSSILASRERRLARVNGRWVQEGDSVAGARVLRIREGAVRFRREQRVFEIRLGGGPVDKNWQTPSSADRKPTQQ